MILESDLSLHLIFAIIFVSVLIFGYQYIQANKKKIISQQLYGDENYAIEVEPVDDTFNWTEAKPTIQRPFKKGPYNLTMGLRKVEKDDWLLLENTYKDVTDLRKEIVEDEEKFKHTVITQPCSRESLCEFYDIALDYMMQRYPKYFYRKSNTMMYNVIREEEIFANSSSYGGNMTDLVTTLSRTIEEDFLVMMKDNQGTGEYYLRGGAFVFPSGLDPAEKKDLSLQDIHGPVPYYKEKIQKSMDKFFERLKIGSFAMRINWTCQAHTQRYAVGINHAYHGESKPEVLKAENLDFDNGVFLRNERQCLLRLPKTKAIVFTIRTYLTPMSVIKSEPDSRENLASAIENLPPATRIYKTATVWGDAIVDYLRS